MFATLMLSWDWLTLGTCLLQGNIEIRGGVHNWEKYCIALLHAKEHIAHFKAIQKCNKKKQEIVWSGGKNQTIFVERKTNY